MSGAPAHLAAMGDRLPVQRQPRGNAPAVTQESRSRSGSGVYLTGGLSSHHAQKVGKRVSDGTSLPVREPDLGGGIREPGGRAGISAETWTASDALNRDRIRARLSRNTAMMDLAAEKDGLVPAS